MDKTLKQLQALTEEARLNKSNDEFWFYKIKLEKYVREKFLESNKVVND